MKHWSALLPFAMSLAGVGLIFGHVATERRNGTLVLRIGLSISARDRTRIVKRRVCVPRERGQPDERE
jgi:hypothetical protein